MEPQVQTSPSLTKSDFPAHNNINHKVQDKIFRLAVITLNGNSSWNRVAKSVTQKLGWNRYPKLNVINKVQTAFTPNNDEEWMQTWELKSWAKD
ncbi:hypothetical protein MKW92_048097, partial [Papaver armeniacum]